VGCSERRKEIRRRRKRREKIQHFKQKVEKATVSEKAVIAAKLRELTPGAETIIRQWALDER
jgi:peptidyl-tRNA hydrolase